MQKTKSKRFRNFKTICGFRTIKKEIVKAKKKNNPLTSTKINHLLKCTPNFLGCYAENELENLTLQSFPCFIIVNIDSNNMPGSHWVALGLFRDRIEIVDPLGFNIFNWSRIPCGLMKFCHRLAVNRKIFVSKRIQPRKSILCGFYCIFYILYRHYFSFSFIFSVFSTALKSNDSALIKQFS